MFFKSAVAFSSLIFSFTLFGASLTTANVPHAVNQALDWTRKGGGPTTVSGTRELPQENMAVADVIFENFQYNANNYDIPVQRDEVTPPEPDIHSPTFNQDMANLPAKQRYVAQYSGKGSAVLKHYNDGRWVLTEVNIGQVRITCDIAITDGLPAKLPTPPSSHPKDGPLDEESRVHIRASYGDSPMFTSDPWLEGRTITVGLVKNGIVSALMTGKCREDLTREITKGMFACHKGETVNVRFEMELRYTNSCGCWEPGTQLSAKQLLH
ncbi:MAG: hypothetical protein LAP87_30205 [Acidobacteriia bacterium]|nr:hypothetical protein [Terriglobia bacterium]